MSMMDLVRTIEQNGKGVRAYIECMRISADRLANKSDLSAAYFLLNYAAGKFVDTYDDQPLLSNRAEEEFIQYKNYVEQLSEIETASNDATKFGILNRVATEIANHKLPRSNV